MKQGQTERKGRERERERRGGCLWCLGVTFSAGGGLKENNGWRDGEDEGKRRGGRSGKKKRTRNAGGESEKWKLLRKRSRSVTSARERTIGQETWMRLHNCRRY